MNRYAVNLVDPKTRWIALDGQFYELAEGIRGYWGIYDRALAEPCGLPRNGNLLEASVLAWPFDGDVHTAASSHAYAAANNWLESCYESWGYVPSVGGPHPQDVDWGEVVKAHEDENYWRKRYTAAAIAAGDKVFRNGRSFLIN